MGVSLRVKNIEAVTEAMALGGAHPVVRLNLVVTGDAARYALIWEWGRVSCSPGPKTLWGTNPDGETRVMTKTAPSGFIRINRYKYRDIIKEELAAIRWSRLKPSEWNAAVTRALRRAAPRIAQLISDTAPIDTGDLREAIIVSKASDEGPAETDLLKLRVGFGR